MLKLYDYFRSTASYRVRIALNFKNLKYDVIPVHLVSNGGEQKLPAYKAVNPQQLVPTLVAPGITLGQSMAIMEYLEEAFPVPPLLPKEIAARAKTRQIANIITNDIHPLNNLRVLQYLEKELKVNETQKIQWYKHWVTLGFETIEQLLTRTPHNFDFCITPKPTIADICLVAQVYNAKRFNVPMQNFPTISKINDNCLAIEAFEIASPDAIKN